MASLKALKDRGDVAGFENAVRELQDALQLPDDVVRVWLGEAAEREREVRRQLGPGLKEAALREACHFEFRPPYVTLGCVTIFEKQPGLWHLSVLDTVVIKRIETQNAEELANAALDIIRGIDAALLQAQELGKGVVVALQWLGDAYADMPDQPVNLVRLLCTYGKELRRGLGSTMDLPKYVLSREAFGYVLARLQRLAHEGSDGYPTLAFRGATQHVTPDPTRYVSVPKDDNPRSKSTHSAVTAIAVDARRGENDK